MRTTLDLAGPVLKELKALRAEKGGSLGNLASQLLAEALSARKSNSAKAQGFHWNSQPMSAKVNLADKEALHRALDGR